ncbi:MAG: hypothetical protein H6R42_457, partial [Nitrospirae bacterium]|nr:hypothetical protein [Nitrospirota bacterium]
MYLWWQQIFYAFLLSYILSDLGRRYPYRTKPKENSISVRLQFDGICF